ENRVGESRTRERRAGAPVGLWLLGAKLSRKLGQATALSQNLRSNKEHASMQYRQLGESGLMVPELSLGTGTFGGTTGMFRAWGDSDVAAATRMVDICLEAGLTMFDSADVYSSGAAEEILGQA